jgi:aminoglycoside phosphotransferase (APT) family kinase protein
MEGIRLPLVAIRPRRLCEHASLRSHSPATRDLLARAPAAGTALVHRELVEHDAVHLDFHHRNVLSANGRLTAVIDCEGYRTGDRIFDLVTLGFCLSVADCPATGHQKLWQRIHSACDDVIVDAYIAHQAIRQVDWSIRNRTPNDVAAWMRRSKALLH